MQTGAMEQISLESLVRRINGGELTIAKDSAEGLATPVVSSRGKQVLALSLSERQREEWKRRVACVKLLHRAGISKGQRGRIKELICAARTANPELRLPSADTLMRWLRECEQAGGIQTSLISKNALREPKRRLDSQLLEEIRILLRRHYFVRGGESLRSVSSRIANRLKQVVAQRALGQATSVSYSTVRRVAAETDPYVRDRARHGPAYAAAKWRHSVGGIYATRPMQRVEMDHTVLDLYVIDDRLGIPLGRPMITILINSYSDYILSLYLSFEGASITRLAQSIKFALEPKISLSRHLGLEKVWHTPGLWEMLVVDNGLEFHSNQSKLMSLELCYDIEFCPVRKPWFKPNVERSMRESCRTLPFPGRPQKIYTVGDRIDPKISACVMFSDLCRNLIVWAAQTHALQINQRKLARPIDLLEEGLAKIPPPSFVDNLHCLDIIGGISHKLRVSQAGIEWMYLSYRSPELAAMAKEVAPRFTANIKLNPEDIGSIWVQHPKSLSWINVPALRQDYAAGLTLSQHKLIRKSAKERLRVSGAVDELLSARASLQDMWDSAVWRGKKLKDAAKELALYQGLTSLRLMPDADLKAVPLAADQLVTHDDMTIGPAEKIPNFESFGWSDYEG